MEVDASGRDEDGLWIEGAERESEGGHGHAVRIVGMNDVWTELPNDP